MMECEHCGLERKGGFSFTCTRCGMVLCVDCRVPELHNCVAVVWEFTDKYAKHTLNDFAMPNKE